MRKDNSWKLNALVSDDTKLREYVASRVWQEFDATNPVVEKGPIEEYVEVIIDNTYMGLYTLVQPVDRKSAQLGAGDILYKTVERNAPPTSDEILGSVENGWKVASTVRIKYPKTIAYYEDAWEPMLNYVKFFYELEDFGDMSNLDIDMINEKATSLISIPNACDRYIFNMVTCASDNEFKNVYYAAKYENGAYVMYQYPWDLDLCFGNVYGYGCVGSSTFLDDVTVEYGEVSAAMPLYFQDEATVDYTLSRWEEVRQSFCSYEYLESLFVDTQQRLERSGALAREEEAWSRYGVERDLSTMLDFIERRLEWLDGYFEEKRIE